MTSPNRTRPTVAVLLDNMFEGYESQLWRHLSEAARDADVNLLCFLAGPARGQRLQRVVFDLPSRETVDGIIGIFGTVNMGTDDQVVPPAQRTGPDANEPGCFSDDEAQAFLRRYGDLPVVSVGKRITGIPSVLVDNELGVEAVISHLLEVHGRRRIAFIRGPDGNEEAEARLRGYTSALERRGIPFDPALVCPGDFTFQAGSQAVRALLEERGVAFDALMGANDLMAMEAMRELQRRGVRVPDDVSLVGFDDLVNASSVSPALTTVSQPLQEVGATALQQVLARIRGGPVSGSTVLPTRPVYRRSCGCMGAAEHGWSAPALPPDGPAVPGPAWTAGVAAALEAADPWLRSLPGGGGAAALVEALCAALEGGAGFVEALDAAVSAGLTMGVPPLRWRGFLLGAFEAVRRRAAPEGARLLTLLSRSNVLLGERAEQVQSVRSRELEYEAFVLQQVFRVTGAEEHEFTAALQAQLPRLGVTSFYLARIADPAAQTATLEYHYAHDELVALEPAAGPYPARRIVPGRFTDRTRWTYVLMPLHFGGEGTGFALCACGSMSGSAYDALANQLGRALQASSLLEAVRQHAAELEVRVDERARQLKAAQQQLIDVAHEAGMAEIAVGALHNVGNLLNSLGVSAEAVAAAAGDRVVAGLSRLEELLRAHQSDLPGFFASDPRAALVPEYCGQLVRTLELDRDRIRAEAAALQANVVLVRETIAGLQEYARGGQDELLIERIDAAVLVEAALRLQAANLARHHVQVHRSLATTAPAQVQRFKVVHVLVNLIQNAVEAMQRTREADRVLTVELAPRAGGGVVLRVSDRGEGIPAAALERIFTYGFTTKPARRGFGLHTCANDLHQMGGRIVAESDGPGRGARFTVELPG